MIVEGERDDEPVSEEDDDTDEELAERFRDAWLDCDHEDPNE